MRHLISRFVKFVVRSHLAQLLFLVHLILVVYAVHRLPLANPDSWDSGGGCHGVPIADRVLFYCDATGLLGAIATLDFIGVALFGFFATLFLLGGWLLFWWLPELGFHVFSWIVAAVLLIVTSFQWMLVGAASNDCCGALPEMLMYNQRRHRTNRWTRAESASFSSTTCP